MTFESDGTPDNDEQDTSGVANPDTQEASANGPITPDTEKGTGDDVEPDTTSGGAPEQPDS